MQDYRKLRGVEVIMVLSLYYRPFCLFCQRVLEAAKRLDAKLDTKNIQEDPQALKELMTLTGKTQVPCLVVDGNPMLESEDIIKWLERNIAP